MNDRQSGILEEIIKTVTITTAAVLLLLASVLLAVRLTPAVRQHRVELAIADGRTELARRLALRMTEDECAAVLQRCSYAEAEALLSEGKLEEAAARFAEAGSYADAADRKNVCDYERASLLFDSEDWDGAGELFRSLGAYSDAADRLADCRYRKALELIDRGEKGEAALLLDSFSGSAEAAELLRVLVTELTGISDAEKALAAFRGMSEAQFEKMTALSRQRASLPRDILDLGFCHTLGLSADGRVLACGDNSCGQCNTALWQNAVAVAAGAWHSTALLSDGTVVCTGRNSEGQCDTGSWTDIVRIAASDYATFGLRADGTVLSTGFLDYEEIGGWSSMTELYAGSYGVAARRSDGSLWIYPKPEGTELPENIDVLALSTGYAAAVTKDGRLVCTFCELPEFSDILTLSAGSTAILGLRADGGITAHFFRPGDAVDFSSVQDAVAVCAGSTHFAAVLSDGSVRVFGDYSHGEGDTGGWILKVNK